MSRSITKSWIEVSPADGHDGATVSIHVQENTGRNDRQKLIVATTSGGAEAEALVNQIGKAEHVYLSDEVFMQFTDESVTVWGSSNSKKLTFSAVSGGNRGGTDPGTGTETNSVAPFVTVPTTYKVFGSEGNEITVNNGTNISGDPGADNEYDFMIVLPLISGYVNSYPSERCRLKVLADNGSVSYCNIVRTQDSFITINGNASYALVIQSDETTKQVQIDSNDSWTIEVTDYTE